MPCNVLFISLQAPIGYRRKKIKNKKLAHLFTLSKALGHKLYKNQASFLALPYASLYFGKDHGLRLYPTHNGL